MCCMTYTGFNVLLCQKMLITIINHKGQSQTLLKMTNMGFTIHLGKVEKKLKMVCFGVAEIVQVNTSLTS